MPRDKKYTDRISHDTTDGYHNKGGRIIHTPNRTEVDYSYTGIANANAIVDEKLIEPSTFETIDYAFYDFLNDTMNLRAYTNKGWKKVPIVWSSSERAFFSKEKKELTDLDGTIILPMMGIERTAITKDLNFKGSQFGGTLNFNSPYHGSRMTVARRIVDDKTRNFAVADNRKRFDKVNRVPGRQSYFKRPNKKIVVETISMPIPVFVGITHVITIRTEYVQQMNQLLQPFATLGGHINSFLIKRDGHQFETFLQSDLAQANNISSFDQEERVYQTKLSFQTLGYLIGEGDNGERPKFIKRQNAVEVKMPRERVIVGDVQQYLSSSGFYRE